MKSGVSFKRWKEVQDLAHQEWCADETLVEREFEEARRKYQKILIEIEKKYQFPDNWRLLDLGCGPTLVGRLFTKGALTGVDPLVEELGIQRLYPNFKVIQGRGEELPFADNSFDAVFCRNVIDHTQSPTKVVSEAARVLKNSGLLLLACYVYTPPIVLMKFLSEKLGIQKNVGHPFTFTPPSFRNLVLGKFAIEEEVLVHEGMGPHDYGKVDEPAAYWSRFYDLALFLNFKVLRQKWFVREILLVCKKNPVTILSKF